MFDFKVGEWAGGIGLIMRHAGYAEPKETGAGIWPTIDKAKEVADQTVKRLLDPGCRNCLDRQFKLTTTVGNTFYNTNHSKWNTK